MGRRTRVMVFAFALALACALSCGKAPNVPESSPGSTQILPFDRQPPTEGTSPTQSLLPSATRMPEGTSLVVRLQKPLSSVSAHAGDNFEGTLDESVVLEGQTVIARGVRVTGRVLDVRRSGGDQTPGYLRIALASVNIGGTTVLVDTSSIFAKAGSHPQRPSPTGTASPDSNDVVIPLDRRLTFRLIQATDFK